MSTIHGNTNITLDGTTSFSIGSDLYSWNGGWLNEVDIYADDFGQSYDVTINFEDDSWEVGRLLVEGPSIGTITITAEEGSFAGVQFITLAASESTNLTFFQSSFHRLFIRDGSDDTVNFGTGDYVWTNLSDGDDVVTVGAGNVGTLLTDNGEDSVTFGADSGTTFAGTGADDDTVVVEADAGVSVLETNDGNDTVTIGSAWVGSLNTGSGNDTVTYDGEGGGDMLHLEDGDNELVMKNGAGVDMVLAFSGNDTVIAEGDGFIDALNLGGGNNSVMTSMNIQYIRTRDGDDTVTIDGGGDVVRLGDGNNALTVNQGYLDSASMGEGDDTVTISAGASINTLDTQRGKNTITVEGAATFIAGWMGENNVSVAEGGWAGNITLGGDTNNVVNVDGGVGSISLADGDDTVIVSTTGGVDSINVGSGNDTVTINGYAGTVRGGGGSAMVHVTSNVNAYVDNITLWGEIGHTVTIDNYVETVSLGRGGDTLNVGPGGLGYAHTYRGNDIINFSAMSDSSWLAIVSGGRDTDLASFASITGGISISLAIAGPNITAYGQFALLDIENLTGGSGKDTLTGSDDANTIKGGQGNDTLEGGSGSDTVQGDGGNDVILIKSSSDFTTAEVIDGGVGVADRIRFTSTTAGQTLVLTNNVTNIEIIDVSSETGSLVGTTNLHVNAAALATAVAINGNGGNNILTGSAFADQINGGSGNDTLNGGGLSDTLDGGAGNDFFRFADTVSASNIDTILNYSVADDRIQLDNAYFTELLDGGLPASAFTANASGLATTAAQRIIYETDTGKLFYDSNGSAGGGTYQQFAQLSAGLAMTAGEFFVI
jgi:Ca2+-binding RTX toxin-like protein